MPENVTISEEFVIMSDHLRRINRAMNCIMGPGYFAEAKGGKTACLSGQYYKKCQLKRDLKPFLFTWR